MTYFGIERSVIGSFAIHMGGPLMGSTRRPYPRAIDTRCKPAVLSLIGADSHGLT
ncbi:hypothetical protein AArcS_2594 [Natranaeroarchaeum sulfidigenes]|uniref:Uncharacterized protein n=1 Tax=Natranaeroarchaeum sulfidigenes TaxID=2784880 RepID=A0A897MNP0_9EURY|nr:hypothetical protein AArcS_2594 [Natranaeroarchaeum sulfidigenes]